MSADNVFLGLGYEGSTCYMAVLVNAPGAGAVRSIFRGDSRAINDLIKLSLQKKMDALEVGFVSALMREHGLVRGARLATHRW